MEEVVLFHCHTTQSGHRIAVATLNQPSALNALSLAMVDKLYAQLQAWQQDDSIVAILLEGAGDKAFCAGGDIRAMYHAAKAEENWQLDEINQFFSREYRLDYLIHRYSKPIIVWGSGIVMGGGLGLMVGASHRIVTETSKVAMPEISIGLFPDVGATFFLNRMPGLCGRFLGLTGHSINGADLRYVGLADHHVLSQRRSQLLPALLALGWQDQAQANHDLLSCYLRGLEEQDLPHLPHSLLHQAQSEINELMTGDSLLQVAEQLRQLEADSLSANRQWLLQAKQRFFAGSPITAHLVWQQLEFGAKLTLEQVFEQELIWAVRCASQGDFIEGVRALLIDKDHQPNWRFGTLESVPADFMQQMQQSPWPNSPLADLKESLL